MTKQPRQSKSEDPSGADEILSHLEEAGQALLEQERSWETRVGELERALSAARDTNRDLGREMGSLQERLEAERERAERTQERADRLRELVKDIHRALFSGNVYELILRACLTMTGATRGIYVTWREGSGTPDVRAAVDVDGYPDSPASDFLIALCRRALDDQETIVCNAPEGIEGIPAPERRSEHFRNCALAPVLLQKSFDGIVLVADKLLGDFGEEDLDALLSIGGQASVALENSRLQQELQNAYLATITVLADAVEVKDPYTHGHCELACLHALLTADRLGLSEEERGLVCYAALLHDVGKIGVSDGILNKPGALLPEERELVRAHARVGHDLLISVPALEAVAKAVLHHHEWYDGSGYPEGLKGEEIPMASRVIAVVDAYGAMTSRRSYKDAFTQERARKELRDFTGTQFDPAVVDAFLTILNSPQAHLPTETARRYFPTLPSLREVGRVMM